MRMLHVIFNLQYPVKTTYNIGIPWKATWRDIDHGMLHWRDCIAYQCNLVADPYQLASLTQMSAKCYMRSTKEIKLSAASIN